MPHLESGSVTAGVGAGSLRPTPARGLGPTETWRWYGRRMRFVLAAGFIGTLLSCVTTPDLYKPTKYGVNVPDGLHTERPLPCDFDEKMLVQAEGWSPFEAMVVLSSWVSSGQVDAVIDVTLELRWVDVPVSQCEDPGVLCEDVEEFWVSAKARLYEARGLGVDWVCDEPESFHRDTEPGPPAPASAEDDESPAPADNVDD